MAVGKAKAIKCGRLIDGSGARPVENATVIIEGPKIKAVGKNIEIPDGAEVIDATGRTVMPGLIDSHMHLMGMKTENAQIEGIVRSRELGLIKSISDSKDLLRAGFTTAKDCGGPNGVFLRKAVSEGTLTGLPRIIAAGYMLSQTAGAGDLNFLPPECVDARTTSHSGLMLGVSLLCDGVDKCIQATRHALRFGADFIKIFANGGVLGEGGRPSDTQFNIAEIEAIVQTAGQVGAFVSAHCINALGVKNAILGGVKTVEHADEVTDELVDLGNEKGVIFVSTLAVARLVLDQGAKIGLPAFAMERVRAEWDKMCSSYRTIRKTGGILAVGTDYDGRPSRPLTKNAIELELLVKYCDFSPMDAIVAATKHGAMACFIGDKTGTIEPDKLADIIVIDGDPLADITILQNLENIKMVMLEGKVEIERDH